MARKPSDARTIFLYAEAFTQAAIAIAPQFKTLDPFKDTPIAQAGVAASTATLDSFGLELYLKCLQTIDFGKPQRGHDCKKLFESLKQGTKDSVKLFYNQELKTDPMARELEKRHPEIDKSLDNLLVMSSETFEKVRYLFEGLDSPLFYWPMIRVAVRKTIVAIHPEWNNNLPTVVPAVWKP